MATVTIELPRAIRVDDYHELQTVENALWAVGCKAAVREIGFDGRQYVGVVYTGPFPGDQACLKIIEDTMGKKVAANVRKFTS